MRRIDSARQFVNLHADLQSLLITIMDGHGLYVECFAFILSQKMDHSDAL